MTHKYSLPAETVSFIKLEELTERIFFHGGVARLTDLFANTFIRAQRRYIQSTGYSVLLGFCWYWCFTVSVCFFCCRFSQLCSLSVQTHLIGTENRWRASLIGRNLCLIQAFTVIFMCWTPIHPSIHPSLSVQVYGRPGAYQNKHRIWGRRHQTYLRYFRLLKY